MNAVQTYHLTLMRLASFNEFDGDLVANSLGEHRDLWQAAIMTNDPESGSLLIGLRDLPDGEWNVDTMFILAIPGKQDELEQLAQEWSPDVVDWIEAKRAKRWLGVHSDEVGDKTLLRIWWD